MVNRLYNWIMRNIFRKVMPIEKVEGKKDLSAEDLIFETKYSDTAQYFFERYFFSYDSNVERIWEQYWQPVMTVDEKIDMEKMKKVLCDYYFVIKQLEKVYPTVTNNKVKGFMFPAEIVLGCFYEYVGDEIKKGKQGI